ncbi:hydrogenase expression protein [Actinoplanes awajinensis subsp. mycoplanecinus]|uniref:Hydrogenase expression protein n=1 Tax=Actinoplanes awajinensis subsp. mycoplanecinus TaxID=135947 RepID=A0A101J7V0_9ACTN|nr:efflux RND transporter permease subunit [Actinoplanes awajinensis]KUL21838.1 hydrogenase expression protein [Actinoplanes awajinensis subsp. mycoplanecinus]
MSYLSRISLANRKLVALVTLLVVALGGYAASSLKQQLLPDLSFPAVTVLATYPGAAPEVVEEQVTAPIEDAVKAVTGVETMTSTSRQGSVTVTLSFGYDTDIGTATGDIQESLAKARLPEGVDPQVLTGSTGDMPTMTLAATSGTDLRALAAKLTSTVVPALQAIDGVNEVSVSGNRDRIVTVTPDAAALRRAGLTEQSIITALSTLGGTSSAGSITAGGKNLSLAVGASITSLDRVESLWLAGGKRPVQLETVAAVTVADAEVTSITRTDGRPSLGMSLTMDHDGSSSSISDDVRAQLPGLVASLGAGAALTVVSDSGPQVKDSVDGLLEEGALGLLMAIVVIVLFLRSGRSTLVTAVSIPLSLLIALTVLWLRDYSLNILTLGGLTIAVGRVVDDSIVVLENIKRHLGYGEDRRDAIIGAVREVASAVTSSTLTTVAVFLPIAFVSGMVGELFGSFAITVTVAMLASLIVSLTVVPALAYWFLKAPVVTGDAEEHRARVEAQERAGRLPRIYLPVINWSVRHRKTVLGAAAALLAATVGMAGLLKTSFLGDSGQDSLRVTQTLPAGTDLAGTDAAAQRVEKVLAATPGVASYQVTIGSSGGFFGASNGTNTVSYTVNLAGDADADAITASLTALSGAGEIGVGSGGGFGGGSAIEVSVRAADDATLTAATTQVQQALATVTEVKDVSSDLSESAPQISIVAKGEQAARYGVGDQAIVSALRTAVQGATVTRVTLDGAQHDVVVRTGATEPDSLAAVKALPLMTPAGPVRLDRVATVTQVDGPVQRVRIDGDRTNTVTATPVGDDTGAASSAVQSALGGLALPAGATYETGGVTSQQGDAFSQLILAIAVAIGLVFLILVAVFGSIRQTFVLLVSIPFAFVGAIALLLVTGTPMGVAALIGLLMLIGIVVTNAIVLMDLINQYRERGLPVAEAVVEGGLRRLRPILMTALATIFALLPMALGITGSGGFISQPLAVVVIGGLVTSTLLTLVLIPVLYTMVESRRRPERSRAVAAPAATPSPEPVPVG